MKWLGWTLARLVAAAVALLGAWIFIVNLAERGYDQTWVFVWVLFSGLIGAVGGTVYLLSIDGPERFRTRSWRLWGWAGMLGSALLPHSFTFIVLPAVLALFLTVLSSNQKEAPVTSP